MIITHYEVFLSMHWENHFFYHEGMGSSETNIYINEYISVATYKKNVAKEIEFSIMFFTLLPSLDKEHTYPSARVYTLFIYSLV